MINSRTNCHKLLTIDNTIQGLHCFAAQTDEGRTSGIPLFFLTLVATAHPIKLPANMNKFIYVSTFLLITASLSSCGFEEKKKALDAREASLREREEGLLIKEKMLTQLEDSIKLSIAKQDSLTLSLKSLGLPLPDSLQGTWNVNMLCTQTNCSGSAVGDTRKESWTFSGGDSTGVYVKAMQGENLIRVYSGIYDGSGFILSTPNVAGDANATSMNVKLSMSSPDKLNGTRIIQQADGCTVTYKLDADRSKK